MKDKDIHNLFIMVWFVIGITLAIATFINQEDWIFIWIFPFFVYFFYLIGKSFLKRKSSKSGEAKK